MTEYIYIHIHIHAVAGGNGRTGGSGGGGFHALWFLRQRGKIAYLSCCCFAAFRG